MDTIVGPPIIPVPFPPQFSYTVSSRAVVMLNLGCLDAANVKKPNRHILTPHTDNHALESSSTGTAHVQRSQAPLDPFNTFRVILPTHAEPPQYRNSTCLTSKTVMFKVIVPFNLIYQIVYPPTHPLLRCTISRLALSHNMSKSCGLLRRKNVTFRRHERQIFILLSGSTRLFVLQTRGSMAT